MLKRLATILAALVLILVCGATIVYGIHLLRAGGPQGLQGVLSKPEHMLYPYDLDARPSPSADDPAALLPQTIGAFRREEPTAPGPFVAGLGLADAWPGAPVEARYQGEEEAACLLVARFAAPADAKEWLAALRDRLLDAEGVKTYRAELYGEHPYVKYRYGGWESGPHGLAWVNGEWLFFVYAETSDALDAVAGAFPY